LHGVAPIPSAGGTGAPGVADDLALLADAISQHGIAIDDLVIVTTASLGTKIRTLAGPHFADAVLTSAYIPAGTVIGVIPQGLAAGYSGIAEIETSTAASIHMEADAPLPIGTPGSPPVVAAPTLSAFQSGLIVIKVRGRCAWCAQPNAVSVVTGAAW
jgi:hypothetical protein